MKRWNNEAPTPDWVRDLSPVALVETFQKYVFGTHTHEQVGRAMRDMRKPLYCLLLDGIERRASRAKVAEERGMGSLAAGSQGSDDRG